MKKSAIIILDDHPMITDGVHRLLEGHPEFELIKAVHSWKALISAVSELTADILILDLNINGANILDRFDRLHDQFPKLKVLIFSSYNNPSLVKKVLSKSVHGYLLKDTTHAEMVEALQTINAGKRYIGKRVATPKEMKLDQNEDSKMVDDFDIIASLTERELEVIKHMAEGCNSQEIAVRLFISPHTVQSHRKNIMRKLQLHSASEVVRFAIQNNLG